MNFRSKAELQEYLERQKERFFNVYGGEVVRHASPENPPQIQLGRHHAVPNLVEQGFQEYLEQLRQGTYRPDTNYQERRPSKRAVRLDDIPL